MAPREFRHALDDIQEAIEGIQQETTGKAFTASARSLEPDHVRQLRPVDRVEPAVLRFDGHEVRPLRPGCVPVPAGSRCRTYPG